MEVRNIQQHTTRHTILVVDDEEDILDTLQRILTVEGYDVVVARSGRSALEYIEQSIPSAVLTDIQMPGMSGYELCRQLKSSPSSQAVPVLLITGLIGHSNLQEGIEAGADDYLRKPIDADDVLMRVRNQILLKETIVSKTLTEKRFEALFDGMAEGVVALSLETKRIVLANPAACEFLGYSSEEILTLSMSDLVLLSAQEQTARITEITSLKGASLMKEVPLQKKNREVFHADIRTASIVLEGERCVVGFLTDVSERITYERELETERHRRSQMEIEYRNAQKLEAVGQLAAGIAHEINTPAQFVGDNSRFLKDAFNDLKRVFSVYDEILRSFEFVSQRAKISAILEEVDYDYLVEEIPRAIDQSIDGIGRIATIVRAMKEFAHPGAENKSHVNINHCLGTTITVSRNEWKYVADLQTDFDDTLPLIPCLPSEINQVFLNLIVNAAHAIGEKITAGDLKGKGVIEISTNKTDENEVEVRIRDNGSGIPESIRDRIMEPFFTTKEVGKGTGQGLALAYSIVVDKHGGRLAFESQVGEGTAFIVTLPVDEPAESAVESPVHG